MSGPIQLSFDVTSTEQRLVDIQAIHEATAIYTAAAEIQALLDQLGWPEKVETILDPGAGDGGFVLAALARLQLPIDDVAEATRRVRGYEFHPGAVQEARKAIFAHLMDRGWSFLPAQEASYALIEERDFLLDLIPAGWATAIAANPPYWRLANLPPSYRFLYEHIVPAHARADLLYAYLQRSADVLRPGGNIGVITADRWLFNAGASELRERIGKCFYIENVQRLDPSSAFYRAKKRKKGSLPRVHPVSLILSPSKGRRLGRDPFAIDDPSPEIEGMPLASFAKVILAPWLGPDGIFLVKNVEGLPPECLVPVVETEDFIDGELRSTRKWAIITSPEKPNKRILTHLEAELGRMPKRGRRKIPWLPPESFAGRLPLPVDAIFIPRIARRLRPIRLPAGHLPVGHDLIVTSPFDPDWLIRALEDPRVQAQADSLAVRIDGEYRSYSATLLRQLIIPQTLG